MGLEQSERGGERLEVRAGTAGRGRGQVLQGSADHEEDLGFYPEEDGSPRGFRQKRDLIQVTTDTLWWLLPGKQIVGRQGRNSFRRSQAPSCGFWGRTE